MVASFGLTTIWLLLPAHAQDNPSASAPWDGAIAGAVGDVRSSPPTEADGGVTASSPAPSEPGTQPIGGEDPTAEAPRTAEAKAITPEDEAFYGSMSLEALLAVRPWSVTTASKREQDSMTAPGTVFVVTKEDILLRGYASIVDVLRDLPGMEVAEYANKSIGSQVAVRGLLGNHKIVVLVNGMRVNPPGGDPIAIRQDFSMREVEQVEIIYGPGSTLYGQDAISALINVKTRKPSEERLEAGAGAGYPSRYEVWGNLNKRLGAGAVSGFVSFYDSTLTNRKDAYPAEWASLTSPWGQLPKADEIINHPKRWDRGVNAMLHITQGNATLQLWHRQDWGDSSEGRQGGLFLPEVKYSDRSTVAEAKHVLKLTDSLDLSSALTFNRYEVLPSTLYELAIGNVVFADYKYALGTSTTLEETFTARIGDRVSLLGGVFAGQYDITPLSTVPKDLNTSGDVGSQSGTIDYYTVQGDPTSKVSFAKVNDVVYENLAAYAEATAKLHERLRLVLGARLDKDTRFGEIPFSPRGALIVSATERLTFKGIYTQAYVAPAPNQMYDIFQLGPSVYGPNLKLKPETARSLEINASFRRGTLLASASAFYNHQRNLLLRSSTNADVNTVGSIYTSPDPGAAAGVLYQNANGGTNEVWGGEAFGRYGLPKNRASLWGSYSYVDARMTLVVAGAEKTSGLTDVSHHNVRAGGTVGVLPDRLFVTLWLSLRSTPTNVLGLTPQSSPATTLQDAAKWPYELGLHVLYRLKDGVDAYVTARNVTNHKYANVGDSMLYPAETFSGIAGLRYVH
jgi:outer membrane receptor protein involved in Fe transport